MRELTPSFLTPAQAHQAAERLKESEGRVYISRQRFGYELEYREGEFLWTYVEDGGADAPEVFTNQEAFEASLCQIDLSQPNNLHRASIVGQLLSDRGA